MIRLFSSKAFIALFVSVLSLTFQSCEDESIAYTLEGTWKGNMYVTHQYNNRVYSSTYTVINFQRNPFRYTSGDGYWIDYYSNAPWDYIANHISWNVRDRVITINFLEESNYIEIYDYRLSDRRFKGVIYDGNSRINFSLTHTDSPNWDSYYYGWNDWYYSKSYQGTGSQTLPRRAFHKAE